MKLKFTYYRAGGAAADLVVEVDAGATIGQLADYLGASDPMPGAATHADPTARRTLAFTGRGGRLLDPNELVAISEFGSGASVGLAVVHGPHLPSVGGAAAVVTILSGPDRGKPTISLDFGTSVIGREQGCEIQLTDPLVSRRHARLQIGDTLEVEDLGSANGIQVGLGPTQKSVLNSGDVVTLGDTELRIEQLQRDRRGVGTTEFVRPARIAPRYDGKSFIAPEPPTPRTNPRFPIIALLTPLLMAGVLYIVTKSVDSIYFALLSPMMLLGNAVESRTSNRRAFAKQAAQFRADLADMVSDIRAEQSVEVATRLAEHPSAVDGGSAAEGRTAMLWSKRPDLSGFAEVRLGLATLPTRISVEMPNRSRAPRELIKELDAAVDSVSRVSGVPAIAELGEGALGISGPRVALLSTSRALAAQLVSLHSPAELAFALITSPNAVDDWDWVKWLPHTSSPQSPIEGRHLVTNGSDATSLVVALENLIDEPGESGSDRSKVVLFVDSTTLLDVSRLVAIAEHGPGVGVYVVWLAAEAGDLPAACKTFMTTAGNASDGIVGYVRDAQSVSHVHADAVDARTVRQLGARLAAVEDAGARVLDDSDLPRSISQFTMLRDVTLGSRPESIIERWQQSNSILEGPYAPLEMPKKAGTLRAIVGMSGAGIHALDLRADGPHAFVGGTTNAGKSEFLQSWILSLATMHSPQRVTFLLIDYKGGTAFADCAELPHTLDVVTDLQPAQVRRALTSLRAELKKRMEVDLHPYGAKDIIELEKNGLPAPPSLIIVVDEMKALIDEVPDFFDGLVDIGQRGRSMGMHLILATQQPKGVIKGSLRANSNLRVALRVADAEDSNDIVGNPAAAAFDPSLPGRAISRTGSRRATPFQTAYAGGWTSEEPDPPSITVEELTLLSRVAWEVPDDISVVPKDRDKTDIKRLVANILAANKEAQLPKPRDVWLPPLKSAVDIRTLKVAGGGDVLIFGLGDRPQVQSQPVVLFEPGREGNIIAYGAGGSGKSGFLRALAIAVGFAGRGGYQTHVYGLDYGSGALDMLSPLPYVGSIIPGSDGERVTRLILRLRDEIVDRKARYNAAGVTNIADFRNAVHPAEPRILLLVDNYGGFLDDHKDGEGLKLVGQLVSIAREGRSVGIHLAMTALERNVLTTAMASAMQRRIVLRQADASDYPLLGAPDDVLSPATLPGRALDGDLEVQIAVLGQDGSDQAQTEWLVDFASGADDGQVVRAPEIRSLPTHVKLDDCGVEPGDIAFGMAADTFASVGVEARGGFLLTGPAESGRSTALETLLTSARHSLKYARYAYFGSRRSELAAATWWDYLAVTVDQATELAKSLLAEIANIDSDLQRVVIVIEGSGAFVGTNAEAALNPLVKAAIAAEHWVIAEGDTNGVGTGSFLTIVKGSRRGLVLQPEQENGNTLLRTPFPKTNRDDFPAGRGFFVDLGRVRLVQVAEIERQAGRATHSADAGAPLS